jgi:hypothetical protein
VPIAGGITGIVFIVLGLCALAGKMKIQTKDMVIAVGHFLIGIGFLLITFMCTKSTREFIGKAKISEGVVIDTTYGGSHPDVAYTTASGENRRFPANGLIFGYRVGDRVRVLYDPANLAHPNIDDFGALYAGSIGYGLFGVCFICGGIMSLFGLVKIKFGRY